MNNLKNLDNFYQENDGNLSLSLEASFRNDGKDKGDNDDLGNFLNDPDDLNIGVTNQSKDQEQDEDEEDVNPLDQAVDQADLISEEEAASAKNNGQIHLGDDFQEVEYANNQHILNSNLNQPDIAQMSFLKEFEQFQNKEQQKGNEKNGGDKSNRQKRNSSRLRNNHSGKGRQQHDIDVEDDNMIRSNFMCCYIEQPREDGMDNNEEGKQQKRVGLNCILF
ncbi:UNKNOWN [Stylonychia lemnae]|uniref:Uncharacterized protein n=1 Tax=Stylonychia lemnae TaxID=5949 RepID=A0A078AFA1_STYLE|nr:UNKNOWN [Stylonychia lemnae]|eukprot:CDW80914.1 UNKNOWN [Stylonychia lemnae]